MIHFKFQAPKYKSQISSKFQIQISEIQKNIPCLGGTGSRGGGRIDVHPHPNPLPSREREKQVNPLICG
jgi:hypothetical protein